MDTYSTSIYYDLTFYTFMTKSTYSHVSYSSDYMVINVKKNV